MSIPRQSAIFDEHRNTSRVFPVPPEALPNARRALAAFHRDDPALASWVSEGAPRLTEAEHLYRFGEPYVSHKRKARGD